MEASTEEKVTRKTNLIFIFFSIMCIAAIGFCLLFPRGTYICITIILVICWLIALGARQSKGKFNPPVVIYPILMFVLFAFMYLFLIISLSEVIFCERRPWEYEWEIRQLKKDNDNLFYFPDELPEDARNVKWVVVPSVWQAKGCLMLSFVADDAYLEKYRLEYEDIIIPATETMDAYMIVREELYPKFSEEFAKYEENQSFYENVLEYSPEDYAHMIMNNMLPQEVSISSEEIQTATQYHIRNTGRWGYIIVESTNRIIFYCDYEG